MIPVLCLAIQIVLTVFMACTATSPFEYACVGAGVLLDLILLSVLVRGRR